MSSKRLSKMPVKPIEATSFDLDDDDGWQDMPIVREVDTKLRLDEEDQKKYRYVIPSNARRASVTSVDGAATDAGNRGNAIGNLIDVDESGHEWREKIAGNDEESYTRLKLDEDDDAADEAYLRTQYLFDEDKAMTPLSQMQATKNLLTEAQRIAYVGLCALVTREMAQMLALVKRKELNPAIKGLELWRMRIMGRVYYHMELETDEQKMIESLATHGVTAMDLVPALMTTHTVANPEYDPALAKQKEDEDALAHQLDSNSSSSSSSSSSPSPPPSSSSHDLSVPTTKSPTTPNPSSPSTPQIPPTPTTANPTSLLNPGHSVEDQTTANVLQSHGTAALPGVSTTLSSTDKNVTLDIRWTVLCDLFLILIADSVYDSRSRMLLENVAEKLGLGWLDVVRFEQRVTDALEIEEGAQSLQQQEVIDGRSKAARKRRYMMMGLATLGGGLVIGLSAGLLAPVIGVGLGAALSTVGIGGTSAFLTGVGGAAMITTGGVVTGSTIAAKGMSRRTRQVQTFDLLPLHNNKRVSCIITVPGFMAGLQDDVRLPFSVLDPIVGDVFSVLWEPEMMNEMGNALKILTGEVLSQVGTTLLQATIMTTLMSALQWPIILTKLGYLIDNPWSNALDRAYAAGLVLADVLLNRALGVRPITLMGFSLGARVIFYALVELAKHKAFGIVQDVFLFGTTVTASQKTWLEARGVVAGRFVNGYARNDWILNYLFRATTGGGTVAGLRPIDGVPGLENVDVTDKIAGHMSYRFYMPLILDQLGFPVSATYFDEPEEPDIEYDREVAREEEAAAMKKKWADFNDKLKEKAAEGASKPAGATTDPEPTDDDELPPRMDAKSATSEPSAPSNSSSDPASNIPTKAGFDFNAIAKVLGKDDLDPSSMPMVPADNHPTTPRAQHVPLERSGSAPPPLAIPKAPIRDANTDSATPTVTSKPLPIPVEVSAPSEPSLPSSYSTPRSHSLDDPPPEYSSDRTPEKAQSNWPPAPGALFASMFAENTPWRSSSTGDLSHSYSSSTSSPFANPGPLRRQAPPAISFGALNGAIPTSTPSSSRDAGPQLSFGSADGDVAPLDASGAVPRDPWAPKPIGLDAAMARKTNYTLNPWET
ncbi:DUF726-domain-containing protein [Clavulina sp. PMI_390]|nr:DUF726-domain-containing protein [Clavulina sp. PMI_390]